MRSEKSDRRVKYTKMVLRQSLLSLMRERPLGRITVTDVCTLADINRNTFYAHYGSPAEVLEEIERELLQDVRSSVENYLQVEDVTVLLTEILRSLERNRALCSVLFSEHGDAAFLNRILNTAHDGSIRAWTQSKRVPDAEAMEMLYAFYANGSAAVIRHWVARGFRETPMEMAVFLQRLIGKGIQSFGPAD